MPQEYESKLFRVRVINSAWVQLYLNQKGQKPALWFKDGFDKKVKKVSEAIKVLLAKI